MLHTCPRSKHGTCGLVGKRMKSDQAWDSIRTHRLSVLWTPSRTRLSTFLSETMLQGMAKMLNAWKEKSESTTKQVNSKCMLIKNWMTIANMRRPGIKRWSRPLRTIVPPSCNDQTTFSTQEAWWPRFIRKHISKQPFQSHKPTLAVSRLSLMSLAILTQKWQEILRTWIEAWSISQPQTTWVLSSQSPQNYLSMVLLSSLGSIKIGTARARAGSDIFRPRQLLGRVYPEPWTLRRWKMIISGTRSWQAKLIWIPRLRWSPIRYCRSAT